MTLEALPEVLVDEFELPQPARVEPARIIARMSSTEYADILRLVIWLFVKS